MSTRSGARYKSATMDGSRDGEAGETEAATMTAATTAATATGEGDAPLADLVRLLMEDRRLREEELAEERRRGSTVIYGPRAVNERLSDSSLLHAVLIHVPLLCPTRPGWIRIGS